MPKAFEIVMESRRELVNKIITMMENGYVFTMPEWNQQALSPMNPLSGVVYRGGNKLRLMNEVLVHEYKDPRWATFNQLKDTGYKVRSGAKGVLCEKWIFTKEVKKKQEGGKEIKETVVLEQPQVSFFTVFNGEQVLDFPELPEKEMENSEVMRVAEDFISTSECTIAETGQEKAFYSPAKDKIFLPLRQYFKDDVSFLKTALHEMAHSTGHPDRLNRNMGGIFGSSEYAREELRAELGALFIETDLGIHLNGEHFQDHSNYLSSWIAALKKDPNELFRACAAAERISQHLIENYSREFELCNNIDEITTITKRKIQAEKELKVPDNVYRKTKRRTSNRFPKRK